MGCNEPEPIIIGFSAGLSGEKAALGNSLRNSFMLKVDEINQQGGINGRLIEVIVRDDENNLDQVKAVDEYFIKEGVTLIFGHDYSYKADTILETTKGKNIIVFSSTMSTNTIAGLDDNFFRTAPTASLQGAAIGEYVSNKNKGLIIYDQDQIALVEGIIDGYSGVVGKSYDTWKGSSPFTDSIGEIGQLVINNNYDHIVYIASPEDTMMISSYLDVENYDGIQLSASWALNTTDDDNINYPDGLLFVADDDLTTQAYQEYLKAYEAKYNEKPGNAAINAYEGAIILFEGLKQAERLDYDGIKSSLLALDYVETATGRTKFDPYGDALKVMYYYIIKDGKIIKYEKGDE